MSERAVQALVFDMDGVLVDSEPLHQRAMLRLIAPAPLSAMDEAAIVGTTVRETMTYIQRAFHLPGELDDVIEQYSVGVLEELRRQPLAPLAGAVEVIEAALEAGIPVAVASQSQPRWIDATLKACGLDDRFDVIVSSEELKRGKPAPDIYLRAAELLGVEPTACIAVEDSAPGVQSAHAAGMTVVQLRQTATAAPPQADADVVIASLHDFEREWLHGALRS